MTAVVEVTEGRLKDLRASARKGRAPENELVATIVLSRAGEATPPGLYLLRDGSWEPLEPCQCRPKVCPMCAGTLTECDMCGDSGQVCTTHARSWTLCRDERDKP